VAAVIRRLCSVLLLTTLLGVGGSLVAVTAASAAGSATPPTPHSTVPAHQVRGEHFTRYCVNNYKPNSTVTVVNHKTGATYTVHTGSNGAGCTEVKVLPGCQSVVASGDNEAGTAATSSATVCVLAATATRTSSGALPFTGSNVIVPGTITGVALILIGLLTVFLVRRRRDDDAPLATS